MKAAERSVISYMDMFKNRTAVFCHRFYIVYKRISQDNYVL